MPYMRISQPRPPPSVSPATPVVEIAPPVVASPCACAAASKSRQRAPPCTRAVRRRDRCPHGSSARGPGRCPRHTCRSPRRCDRRLAPTGAGDGRARTRSSSRRRRSRRMDDEPGPPIDHRVPDAPHLVEPGVARTMAEPCSDRDEGVDRRCIETGHGCASGSWHDGLRMCSRGFTFDEARGATRGADAEPVRLSRRLADLSEGGIIRPSAARLSRQAHRQADQIPPYGFGIRIVLIIRLPLMRNSTANGCSPARSARRVPRGTVGRSVPAGTAPP